MLAVVSGASTVSMVFLIYHLERHRRIYEGDGKFVLAKREFELFEVANRRYVVTFKFVLMRTSK